MNRLLARIALIAIAAALFIGLTAVYARSLRPPPIPTRRVFVRQRRPDWPQWWRLPGLAGEGILIALIAAAGRKVLRLRLAERPFEEE